MAMLVIPRLAVPMWVVVVGLVAAFQSPTSVGANVLLLGVGGIVAPALWLLVISRWPRVRREPIGVQEKYQDG
jgi:hypothetical protein